MFVYVCIRIVSMSNALDRLVDKTMDQPNKQITSDGTGSTDHVTDSRLARMELNIEANAEVLNKILELLKSVSHLVTRLLCTNMRVRKGKYRQFVGDLCNH